MGIIIDLIIIAIIALSTFLAYKKGLVKLALGLCTFAIAILVTIILYQPVSNFVINTTGIDEALENSIYQKANEAINVGDNQIANQVIETAKDQMLPQTAKTLAVNIVRAGVMIVLFIVVKIALKFVTAIADLIAKLPILKQLNQAGGIIYGLLRGILVVYVALLVIGIFGQINPANSINTSINSSSIGKTMYQNNVLNIFFN